MLSTDRLLRLFIELIFVLLGLLVMWLGFAGRIFFYRHTAAWPIMSITLVLLGLYALFRPDSRRSVGENRTRGFSLLLLGTLLLAIPYVPFLWVGPLIALAGVVLILRGIAASVLILRFF
ncbi:MAG: hypothetical protein NVS9B4_11640 [Candidatus Acidiferrum sp.]